MSCIDDPKPILHNWIVIHDLVIDVANFFNSHPGGSNYLNLHVGKDATKAFTGDVYDHSNAAHNLLFDMRVARIKSS